VPFAGLAHLEATAIPDMLAGKPVKILVVYLSPSCPLVGADLFWRSVAGLVGRRPER
jgi:hypothetical protein